MIEWKLSDPKEDTEKIVDLCSMWWEEALFFKKFKYPYNIDMEVFFTAHKSNSLMYISGKDNGVLKGFYFGIKSPYCFSKDVMMCQELVWCLKEKNFINLKKMLDKVEEVMYKEHIQFWTLAVPGDKKYEPLKKYLDRKRSYVLMENIFMKGS